MAHLFTFRLTFCGDHWIKTRLCCCWSCCWLRWCCGWNTIFFIIRYNTSLFPITLFSTNPWWKLAHSMCLRIAESVWALKSLLPTMLWLFIWGTFLSVYPLKSHLEPALLFVKQELCSSITYSVVVLGLLEVVGTAVVEHSGVSSQCHLQLPG